MNKRYMNEAGKASFLLFKINGGNHFGVLSVLFTVSYFLQNPELFKTQKDYSRGLTSSGSENEKGNKS